MSWDSYADSIIGHGAGNISKAALIGLDGSIWTSGTKDTMLKVTPQEAASIGKTMKAADSSVFAANGITLEGVKYLFVKDMDNDGKFITGKKTGVGNIAMQATNKAILIAFIPDGKAAGTANLGVNKVADYLISIGY